MKSFLAATSEIYKKVKVFSTFFYSALHHNASVACMSVVITRSDRIDLHVS